MHVCDAAIPNVSLCTAETPPIICALILAVTLGPCSTQYWPYWPCVLCKVLHYRCRPSVNSRSDCVFSTSSLVLHDWFCHLRTSLDVCSRQWTYHCTSCAISNGYLGTGGRIYTSCQQPVNTLQSGRCLLVWFQLTADDTWRCGKRENTTA